METSDSIFPAPKINNRLKLLMLFEILLLLIAYCLIFYSYRNLELQKTEKAIQQMNFSLMENIQQTADNLSTLTISPIGNDSYSVGPTLWNYLNNPKKIKESPSAFENLFIEKYYQINLLFQDMNSLFLYKPTGEILTYKYNNTLYYCPENLPETMKNEILNQNSGTVTFSPKKNWRIWVISQITIYYLPDVV